MSCSKAPAVGYSPRLSSRSSRPGRQSSLRCAGSRTGGSVSSQLCCEPHSDSQGHRPRGQTPQNTELKEIPYFKGLCTYLCIMCIYYIYTGNRVIAHGILKTLPKDCDTRLASLTVTAAWGTSRMYHIPSRKNSYQRLATDVGTRSHLHRWFCSHTLR